MLSKLLTPRGIRALRQPPTTSLLRNTTTIRSFHRSPPILDTATTSAPLSSAAPRTTSKPVGAFRGGIFGFLLGAVCAGAGTFYYVMEEYRVSNELLTEDIYVRGNDYDKSVALQASVQKIHSYVATLEDKVDSMEKKKGK
ncbi:MAG: hypothetical protein OHK93_000983 [Ramalina farinacea]|uniref:Uncharacterized protein n=1 Tax=Ramalina farinacea TaxID=258253 RepID=A0AA43QSY0_9LECA|nr:hypothetical protein [Ramalina farinacea]